jgi:hypothetical protein
MKVHNGTRRALVHASVTGIVVLGAPPDDWQGWQGAGEANS